MPLWRLFNFNNKNKPAPDFQQIFCGLSYNFSVNAGSQHKKLPISAFQQRQKNRSDGNHKIVQQIRSSWRFSPSFELILSIIRISAPFVKGLLKIYAIFSDAGADIALPHQASFKPGDTSPCNMCRIHRPAYPHSSKALEEAVWYNCVLQA
jgi:hypothetical protein